MLFTDYILTVAVSASAGTAALVSAFGASNGLRCPSPSGSSPSSPSNSAGRQGVGPGVRRAHLLLHAQHARAAGARAVEVPGRRPDGDGDRGRGPHPLGHAVGRAVLRRRDLRRAPRLRLGGAAVTGVEAISNGVPACEPAWRNARQTLVPGHRAGRDVLGCRCWPGPSGSPCSSRARPRHRPGGRGRLRRWCGRRRPVLRPAGRHHAHPGDGGQHRVRRLLPGWPASRPATASFPGR